MLVQHLTTSVSLPIILAVLYQQLQMALDNISHNIRYLPERMHAKHVNVQGGYTVY